MWNLHGAHGSTAEQVSHLKALKPHLASYLLGASSARMQCVQPTFCSCYHAFLVTVGTPRWTLFLWNPELPPPKKMLSLLSCFSQGILPEQQKKKSVFQAVCIGLARQAWCPECKPQNPHDKAWHGGIHL